MNWVLLLASPVHRVPRGTKQTNRQAARNGLGSLRDISLARARELAAEARFLVKRGVARSKRQKPNRADGAGVGWIGVGWIAADWLNRNEKAEPRNSKLAPRLLVAWNCFRHAAPYLIRGVLPHVR
jgi:hypothetical protein